MPYITLQSKMNIEHPPGVELLNQLEGETIEAKAKAIYKCTGMTIKSVADLLEIEYWTAYKIIKTKTHEKSNKI